MPPHSSLLPVSALFPRPKSIFFGLTSQWEPLSTTNDPRRQRISCPQLSLPRQTRQQLLGTFTSVPSLCPHLLSAKLHLPVSAPTRLSPLLPHHAHPCTSSKTSQPPGLAGDTSYLSGPGPPGLQSIVPIRPQEIAAPFRTPEPEAHQPGPCPASRTKAPSPRGSVSRPRLDSEGLGRSEEDRKGAAAVVKARGELGARARRFRARPAPGSWLPWPGLSPPALPARASAACPHLIQVLITAAVLCIRVDHDTAFPLLYHGGPAAPTPDAARTPLLPACQWDRHCRRYRRRSTHTKATAHARSAPPLAPPPARRMPFAGARRPAPPHLRRSVGGGATC
jgi:hypothetical protein